MLVLGRRRNEQIVISDGIGSDLTVTVCYISPRGYVTLQLDCDQGVRLPNNGNPFGSNSQSVGLIENEEFTIKYGPETIEVCLAQVEGNKIRLGFNAPREISIIRKELLDG